MERYWDRHALGHIWPEERRILRNVPTRDTYERNVSLEHHVKIDFLFVMLDSLLTQRLAFTNLPKKDQQALAQLDGALREAVSVGIKELLVCMRETRAVGTARTT